MTAPTAGSGLGDLTTRELEVLEILVHGATDSDIATRLAISRKTASVHVANIKAKLGVRTRIEAVLRAREALGV